MKMFEGRLIIQTMFLRGSYEGRPVDNTTEREVSAWLELVKEIGPRQVMIYTIDRDTPDPDLEKVNLDDDSATSHAASGRSALSVQLQDREAW